MRVRVTRLSKTIVSTQVRRVNDSDESERPQEVAIGTVVLYRPPGADGKPRWDLPTGDFEVTVRQGRRLAVLKGTTGAYELWHSSPVDGRISQTRNGWIVRTVNSQFMVEVLSEGGTPRAERRDTGVIPILEPDISARIRLGDGQPAPDDFVGDPGGGDGGQGPGRP